MVRAALEGALGEAGDGRLPEGEDALLLGPSPREARPSTAASEEDWEPSGELSK